MFFLLQGQSIIVNYRGLFMKHLGLSTTQGGIIYAVDRVIGIATPPLLGAISDKTQSPKAVLLWVMFTGALLSSSHCFIPPIKTHGKINSCKPNQILLF